MRWPGSARSQRACAKCWWLRATPAPRPSRGCATSISPPAISRGCCELARREAVGLTIIGPEAPLVEGIVDAFQAAGLRCFGPSRMAARLEGSKSFSKHFLQRHGIPTAAYRSFTRENFDRAWLRSQRAPIVVKASGLASGKGVVIAQSLDEAEAATADMFGGRFGDAGAEVVIEQFLQGEEASFIVMADGEHVLPLATSQDHKRLHDGDVGPNTGGMGAYSPAPVVSSAVHERVMREIIAPSIRGLSRDGTPYTGFLYAGLMIGPDGAPSVVEFNCRFGDPEAQPVLARLDSDLTVLCEAALEGRLDRVEAQWDPTSGGRSGARRGRLPGGGAHRRSDRRARSRRAPAG